MKKTEKNEKLSKRIKQLAKVREAWFKKMKFGKYAKKSGT